MAGGNDNRGLRLGMLGVIAMILIAILGARLWFLQVVDAERITEQVQVARLKKVDLPPERGRIFDVAGRILADNERVLTVIVDQDVIRGRKDSRLALFDRLAGPLKTSRDALEIRYCGEVPEKPGVPDTKLCRGGIYNAYLPFPAAEDIDEATALYLRERAEDFPGVDVQEGWRRKYLYSPTGSQIVGYLGRVPGDNEKTAVNETKEYLDKGYSLNDLVGAAGIEREFEAVLRGTPGKAEFEVDAAGNVLTTVSRIEPVAGRDIQLTIDMKLQKFAEQTLETELRNQRSESPINDETDARHWTLFYKAPAGSVVVEKQDTGEIVAMASYPTFDNRWFSAGVSKNKFKQLFPVGLDPDKFPSPLVNRAIQGRYNVGSTFKPFTAYAGLDTAFITPEYRYEDSGKYKLPFDEATGKGCNPEKVAKCEFKNAYNSKTRAPNVYGSINVAQALAVSSDTFFYRIGAELFERYPDRPVLQDEYKKFGFGAKSGIELPFEYKGIVPDKEIKKLLADQKAITAEEGKGFYVGDAVLMAIGQGLNAISPLQLTNAYATIGNGGYLMRPLIVKAIYDPGVPDHPTQLGYADLEAVADTVAVNSFCARGVVPSAPCRYVSDVRNVINRQDLLLPITDGLICVTKADDYSRCPLVTGHEPTGWKAFRRYSWDDLPIAGKTGTAQGFGSLPENDSSAFAAYQIERTGYAIGAYLEKAGYGARAAAPVVRCLMLAVNGKIAEMDEVQLSDELDINQTTAAPRQRMPSEQCLIDATPKAAEVSKER